MLSAGTVEHQTIYIAANIGLMEKACHSFLQHAAHLCGIPAQERHQDGFMEKVLSKASKSEVYLALTKFNYIEVG